MLISNAQNFEDIILMRALQDTKEGNYIDIGANDPIDDSVSYMFHSKGWHGIHVDPSEYYAKRLRSARPNDIVLQKFVSSNDQSVKFFDFPGTGWGTSDEKLAYRYKENGYDYVDLSVPTISLAEIFSFFRNDDIHWLKIDVEGAERDVLESWGDSGVRPWIIVMEAIEPITHEINSDKWKELILGKGYKKVYFDGINEFYLHEAHKELKKYFGPGPNIFDGKIIVGHDASPVAAHVVRGVRADAQTRMSHLAAAAKTVKQDDGDLDAPVDQKSALADEGEHSNETQSEKTNGEEASEGSLEALVNSLRASNDDLLAFRDALQARYDDLRKRHDVLKTSVAGMESSQAALNALQIEHAQLLNTNHINMMLANQHGQNVARFEQQLEALRQERVQLLDQNRLSRTLAGERQLALQELGALRNSISWRVTAPLRGLGRALRWARIGAWAWLTLQPASRPRRIARRLKGMILGTPPVARAPVIDKPKGKPRPTPSKNATRTRAKITAQDPAFAEMSPRQREIFTLLTNTDQKS